MTKEEAIKICKQVRKYFKGEKLATDDTDAIYGALTEAIEALKAQQWIPCSEVLPNENGDYLVTYNDTFRVRKTLSFANNLYEVDRYVFGNESGWYDYDSEYGYYKVDDVIAWLPLPHAWKGE